MKKINKLLIICGPTACGKTALSLKLARIFKGELISADSRQIYQGLDIISGKDIKNSGFTICNSELKRTIQKKLNLKITLGIYKLENINLWGLDLVRPDQEFSVAHWLQFSHKVIQDIWSREKLPIIVGGTGFWVKALLCGFDTLGIPPVWEFRKQLSNLTIEQLREKLRKLNPERLRKMNKSDSKNPRRLIRAIEIATYSNQPNQPNTSNQPNQPNYDILIIGLKAPNKFLYNKIDKRVDYRIKQGAQKEIADLIKKGYFWNLPSMTTLGCREWQPFFQGSQSLEETIQRWKYKEHAYARRQLTFFKKMKNIKWFTIDKSAWQKKVVKLVESWYYGKYTNDGKN